MRLVLACSLDSFIGALAMQLWGRRRLNSFLVVCAFTFCDCAASIYGAALARSTHNLTASLTPFNVAVCLGAAMVLVVLAAELTHKVLWFLPILLSADNLISALNGDLAVGAPDLSSGVMSAGMSVLGILAAKQLTGRIERTALTLAYSRCSWQGSRLSYKGLQMALLPEGNTD